MNTPLSIALLPCPFCACKMEIKSNRDWHKLVGDHDEDCIFATNDEVESVPATDDQLLLMIAAWSRRALSAQPEQITIHNAKVGTKAPAINGGHWYRVESGWKWNGPDGDGGTFPRPGGDWTGELISAQPEQPQQAITDTDILDWIIDNHSSHGGGNGFEIKVWVPVDSEDIRDGITRAIKLKEQAK